MPTIKVHTGKLSSKKYSKVSYRRSLSLFEDKISTALLDHVSDTYNINHSTEVIFREKNKKILTRNIANNDNIIVDATPISELKSDKIKDSDNIISSETRVLGTFRNYPANVPIFVNKFLNKNHNFTEQDLTDVFKLNNKLFKLWLISRYTKVPNINPCRNGSIIVQDKLVNISKFKIPPKIVSLVDKYINFTHGIKLASDNATSIFISLRGLDLLEIFNEIISGDIDTVRNVLNNYINKFGRNILAKQSFTNDFINMSNMNLLKDLIIAEFPKESHLIDLIDNGKIAKITDVKQHVKDTTYKSIEKRILTKVSPNIIQCNSHPSIVNKLKLLLNKKNAKYSLKDVKDIKKYIESIADLIDNVYVCKTCNIEIACTHHFVVLEAMYGKGNLMDQLEKIAIEYAGKKDGILTYCKYCSQLIFNNKTESIMYDADFETMEKVREINIENSTELARFNSGINKAIYSALSLYKFNYNYSQKKLIKSIQNRIGYIVYDTMVQQKVPEEKIEDMTILYGYIFTVIYLMDIYATDRNITITGLKGRDRTSYANHLIPKIVSRYNKLTNKQDTQKLMQLAYIALKGSHKTSVSYITDELMRISISNTSIYKMLYSMYLNDRGLGLSAIEAFDSIVHKVKPNISNFYIDAYEPSKKSTFNNLIYSYIINYDSPSNMIYKTPKTLRHMDVWRYNPKKFDNSVEVQLFEYDKLRYIYQKIHEFKDIKVINYSNSGISVMSAQYNYDTNGNMIIWEPEKTKQGIRMVWNQNGNKIYLDKMGKLSEKEIKKLIDQRNKKINYKENPRSKSQIDIKVVKKKQYNYKYSFSEKHLGVVTKISSKYSINMFKYLGRSRGYTLQEIKQGKIPDTEITSNDISLLTVNNYIGSLFIQEKNLFNGLHEIVNELKIKQSVLDAVKRIPLYELGKMVDKENKININGYYDIHTFITNNWKPMDVYYWMLEFLSLAMSYVMKTYPSSFGKKFLSNYLDDVFRQEKYTHKLDIEIIQGDGGDLDEDEGPIRMGGDDDIDLLDVHEFGEEDEDNIVISDD